MAARRAIHGLVAVIGASLATLSLATCEPARSLCARVACRSRQICDENTGHCIAPDAGPPPAVDAGTCDPACSAPQRCDTSTRRCVDCLDSSQCACPTPVCSAAFTCVEATVDAGIEVGSGGERCELARRVATCASALHFTVDLAVATDDAEASCLAPASGGGDVVYALELDTTADVKVTARALAGSPAQPVVSIRSACDFFSELGCAASGAASATLHLKSLSPATYLLFIDAVDATKAGQVDVTVEFLAATTPSNETCGTASVLPVDGSSNLVGLANADDDLVLPCNHTAKSPELVYQFTATERSSLLVTTSAGLDSVLSLREDPCLSAVTIACVNDAPASRGERLKVPRLAPGTYDLIVEAVGPATGAVSLTATLGPPLEFPSNDTCTSPTRVSFVQGQATFTTDTSAATDDLTSTCNLAMGSPELVYELVLPEAHTVTVTAQGVAGAFVQPVLSLRVGSCEGASATELACAAATAIDQPATLTTALDAGTSFLVVEGLASAAGQTRVTVTLSP